jgi:hemolysin activation/secretion protein
MGGSRTKSFGRVATLLLLAVAAAAAHAQTPVPRPQLPGAAEPGRELRQPVVPAVPQSEFDLTIQSPRRAPIPRAVDELRFDVREIRINGATVYMPDELRPLWEPVLGQQVGLADIVGVAEAIEAKYRADGYILTRAFVPPQRVGDGVFQINVVEGFVKAVAVDGGSESTRRRIEGMLAPVTGIRPLRQDVIERALLLATDLPGIESSGLLRPSPDEPGASDLVVTVREIMLSGGATVANAGSQVSGRWIAGGDIGVAHTLGFGEQFIISPGIALDFPERYVGIARYLQPIGSDGLLASVTAVGSSGRPGGILKTFDVATYSQSYGARATYPLIRSREQSLFLDGGFTIQESVVNFRGLPGAARAVAGTDQEDKWRVFDISATYVQNGFLAGTTSLTVGLAQGIDFFGATEQSAVGRSRADGRPDFTKLTFAARRLQLIDGPFSAFVLFQAQYSPLGLFAGEEVAFGGPEIGRGYDPASITGDRGLGGTLELRWDERFGEPLLEVIRSAQFYAFLDGGKVFNRDPTQRNDGLLSTGVGVRTNFEYGFSATLEYAKSLLTVPAENGPVILFTTRFRF